jgi:pyruvate formate-lyase activating enzyme-like uncharacterized protein
MTKSVSELYEGYLDNINIENNNCTVYTKSNIELSPGCKSCKEGLWNCLFIGRMCNAHCSFCSRKTQIPHPIEKLGYYHGTPNNEYIDEIVNQEIPLKGVSFSGGETLLYIDDFMQISSELTKRAPYIYKWIYTNGILVDDDNINIIRNVGIDEMRFNLAATNFDSKILNNIYRASKAIKRITVEIPSIEIVRDKLLKQDMITEIINCGVTQLNLSELYTWTLNKDEKEEDFYKNFFGAWTPKNSRIFTSEIIKHVIDEKLSILVNDCSIDSKHHQVDVRKHKQLLRYFN